MELQPGRGREEGPSDWRVTGSGWVSAEKRFHPLSNRMGSRRGRRDLYIHPGVFSCANIVVCRILLKPPREYGPGSWKVFLFSERVPPIIISHSTYTFHRRSQDVIWVGISQRQRNLGSSPFCMSLWIKLLNKAIINKNIMISFILME